MGTAIATHTVSSASVGSRHYANISYNFSDVEHEFLIAVLDDAAVIDESDEGNNDAYFAPLRYDISATSLSEDSSGTLTLGYDILDRDVDDVFEIAIYNSADGTTPTGTPIATHSVADSSKRTMDTHAIDIVYDFADVTEEYLLAVVDDLLAIDESDESNNDTNLAPPRYDVAANYLMENSPEVLTLEYDVSGRDVSVPLEIAVYQSADGENPVGPAIATHTLSDASKWTVGNHSVDISYDYLDADEQYLLAVIDDLDAIVEETEANNDTSLEVIRPDIVADAIWEDTSLVPIELVIDYDIFHRDLPQSFNLDIFESSDGSTLGSVLASLTVSDPSFFVVGSHSVRIPFTFFTSLTEPNIIALFDVDNSINEGGGTATEVTNNSVSTIPVFPDIQAVSLSEDTAPPPADWSNLVIEYAITGRDITNSFDISIYDSADGEAIGSLLHTVTISNHAQRTVGTHTIQIPFDFDPPTDADYLIAFFDQPDAINEGGANSEEVDNNKTNFQNLEFALCGDSTSVLFHDRMNIINDTHFEWFQAGPKATLSGSIEIRKKATC